MVIGGGEGATVREILRHRSITDCLMVDIDGRVLRPNGKPIANLFAGGGAAAGVSGRTGAGGYASGNGLLSAVGLGRLAGLAAAREISLDTAA